VVDLAARRRRRRVTQLLVAAAAVTVIGVGGPQLINGAGDLMSAGDSAESTAGGAEAPAATEMQDGGSEKDQGSSTNGPVPRAESNAARPALIPQGLERQLVGLGVQALAGDLTRLYPPSRPQRRCRGDAVWGSGRRVPVTYDGDPGVAIFRKPVGGQRRVDVILCGEPTPARTVFIPAP
jgi:hypothetical protein